MRRTVTFFLYFLVVVTISAQTSFTFETTSVPTQWVANNGVLAINAEHYKEGVKSLSWTTTGESMFTITPSSFSTGTNFIDFQLHSPVITYDTLKFDFYSGSLAVRSFRLCMNYKGWRDVCRAYSEFASASLETISSITITLLPTNNSVARTYYFDDVNLLSTRPTSRVIGTHWINDTSYFTDRINMNNLISYAYPIDIPTVNPTSTELTALTSLKKISAYISLPKVGTAEELAAAIKFTDSLTIVRNSDGSVRGLPLDLKAAKLVKTTIIPNNNNYYLTTLARYLEVLAADGTVSTTRFNNLLDHLMDQGLAEGLEYYQGTYDYNNARAILPPLFNILPSCTDSQKVEVIKLCKWILLYKDLYLPQNKYLYSLNADIIHLFTDYFMMIALNQPTTTLSVRELKAYKRWLDRNAEYVPGGRDFLKIDGTGFHHATPYIAYMQCFNRFISTLYNLKGTPFQVDTASYNHLKKAVISMLLSCNLGIDKNGRIPLSLGGRGLGFGHPLTRGNFYLLNSIGTDLFGTQDNELAAAYNAFFQQTTFQVPTPANYNGFYAFNYGSYGIYRQANWIACMRSPTSTVFGAEITPTENCFGRYTSYGSLEILYSGSDKSGYPDPSTLWGGWDWNVMPGTTTVHYTNWADLKPLNSDNYSRMDVYTKSKNFSGALSWGDMGLFGCDFDQRDTWYSSIKFAPTNLVFKKTVLAVDGLLIAIGTNISSSSTAELYTNTNLFQSIISTNSQALQVNGNSVSTTFSSSLNGANTLISPTGTGYIIPEGNDPIVVISGSQTSPVSTKLDSTGTVMAAKAYITHGFNPSNRSYQFVVVPGTTATALATAAINVNSGSIYQLIIADSTMHSIYYKPRQMMAYTFFKGATDVIDSLNIVKGISTEALLLERKSTASSTAYDFAIANPNLRPVSDPNFKWIATPTTSVLSLKGEWFIKTGAADVTLISASTVETKVQVTLSEGEPKYFTMDLETSRTSLEAEPSRTRLEAEPSITRLEAEPQFGKPYIISGLKSQNLMINLGNSNNTVVDITFIYTDGTTSAIKKYNAENGIVIINDAPLRPGLNFVKIGKNGSSTVLKTIGFR